MSVLPSARPPAVCLSEWWGVTSIKGNLVKFHVREFHKNSLIYSNFRQLRTKITHISSESSSKRVKCTLVQALRLWTGRTAHRGSRGIALRFLDHGTRRGWGVSVTPWPLFTPGKTRYPLYRRVGGPQGRCGQVRKISPPQGFDPRTVQPVTSRYTDYPVHRKLIYAYANISAWYQASVEV